MLKPYNDHVLVELATSDFVTAEDEQGQNKGIQFGTVIAVPDLEDMMYLATYTWVAENSLLNSEELNKVRERMLKLMGKKIYWEERTDIGNTIEYDMKKYATIKISKVIGVEE